MSELLAKPTERHARVLPAIGVVLCNEVKIVPMTWDYARVPFKEAFNFPEIFEQLGVRSLTTVDFTSVRKPGIDEALLTELDEAAYQEVRKKKGFRFYGKGYIYKVDDQEWCRSSCGLDTVEDVRMAARGPAHEAATLAVEIMYDQWHADTYQTTLLPDRTIQTELLRHCGSDS
jgi:hypothetical protein